MGAIQINRLTNANMYNNGNSLLGTIEEITLPAIKAKNVEHKALGMIGAIELPAGLEKMSGKVKWNSVYPDLITEFGNPYQTNQIQVRGNLQNYDASGLADEVPVVAFISMRFTDSLPPITLKQNDNPELESEYTTTYYRLEVDGTPLIEVDFLANTFFVDGTDIMSQYRSNLGI